jgi:hypothetical protein
LSTIDERLALAGEGPATSVYSLMAAQGYRCGGELPCRRAAPQAKSLDFSTVQLLDTAEIIASRSSPRRHAAHEIAENSHRLPAARTVDRLIEPVLDEFCDRQSGNARSSISIERLHGRAWRWARSCRSGRRLKRLQRPPPACGVARLLEFDHVEAGARDVTALVLRLTRARSQACSPFSTVRMP